MIDWLLDLKNNIDKHGIRWGVFFTLYAVYRKERRNLRLDKRDEAIFHNQRIIMEHLGVVHEWRGPVTVSNEEVQTLKKWYTSSRKAISRGFRSNQRRIRKMNQNINWVTLVLSLLGVLKLVLQPMGVDLSHITDGQVNDIVNGVAALISVLGVFWTHRKPTAPAVPSDPNRFIQG